MHTEDDTEHETRYAKRRHITENLSHLNSRVVASAADALLKHCGDMMKNYFLLPQCFHMFYHTFVFRKIPFLFCPEVFQRRLLQNCYMRERVN